MAKRVSEEIDGVDIFTYDTDLLAAAQELRKPALLELAKRRNYPGLWKLNKLELAIIHADTLTAERDEQRKLPEINAQMTETLDEIAPLPARTLREQYEGTAARFNPEVIDKLHKQAAAIDEKRTIARAFLSTPTGVVLTWYEIQQGYLDAMAERDRIEHNQAVHAEQQRAGVVRADETSRPEFAPGDRLTNPASGHQFEVIEWTHAVILRNLTSGARAAVPAEMARLYRRAEGVAEAKRRVPWRDTFVMHTRTGQRYRVLGMDNIVTGKLIISHDCGSKCSEHERAVSPDVLQWDYIACDENGNVQPLPRNSLNRRSAPAYAVGDRVRWSEDHRLMFVRSVTPTGAYVAPTMDGQGAAFAAYEDLSPASKAARLQVFTAGELYAAPEMPKANVVLNLATMLDDPARRLPTHLVRMDGTHLEVFSFVFASDGAEQIFAETVHYLGGLIQRGPVVLLVLCRGGKHRSVAFGEAVARHFGAPVTHFHKDLVPYGKVSE